MKHGDLTQKSIGAFYEVYNRLGYGFLEKVYENALCIELKRAGLEYSQQVPIEVRYRGEVVGEYFADLVVADSVIVEIKAARTLTPNHEAQLLNYLKATDFEVGLLLNFGRRAEFVRKVFANDRTSGLE